MADPPPTRRVRRVRMVMAGTGAAIALAGVCADWIGLGTPGSGFGAEQIVLLLVGASIALTAVLDRNLRVARVLARPLLACVSVYVALLVWETILQWPRAPRERKNPYIGLRGMYSKDERLGFRLTPGWRGRYDDGMVNVEYRINSRGHRDAEPGEPGAGATRIILMGDSFTFGSVLDQSETIDSQVTALTGGGVDAYNIGVPGYGPPAILETFRRCDWLQGHCALYLFFSNDLRDDELGGEPTATVVDGYLVRTRREDGRLYSEAEARAEIRRRTQPWAPRTKRRLDVVSVLHLSAIRKRIGAAVAGAPHLFQRDLLRGDPAAYSQANVERAVGFTKEMRAVASTRGMRFGVVIVPTSAEVTHQRYAGYSSAYISALRQAGIEVIELLDRLSGDDYFTHDCHFNPAGARKAAKAIVEALPKVRGS